MKRSLYKYFSERQYADAFLEGQILFRSLSYFRDFEDPVRGDEYESTSTFLPEDGQTVFNKTQGTTFKDPRALESTVKAEEIFVFCVSNSFSEAIAREFHAVVCVEITKIAALCARMQAALAPTAAFEARRVDYYPQTQGGNARHAVPAFIATSKLESLSSQDEYRFIFSLTDALDFEKVQYRLTTRVAREGPKPEEHHKHLMKTRSLRDICRLHEFKSPDGQLKR